jgi:hypothetical protein
MKRTRGIVKAKEPPNEGKIVLSKTLRDLFWKQDNPSDVMGLYIFYRDVADWQKTDQPKATDEYCMKGLGWGRSKFSRTKKQLLGLDLIEQIRTIDKTGRVTGYYIKVNYLWKEPSNVITGQSTENNRLAKIPINGITGQSAENPVYGDNKTNALKTNIINTKKDLEKNKKISSGKKINTDQFDEIYNKYPDCKYKGSKGKAQTVWNKLCALPDDSYDKPTLTEIKKALHHQKLSERWHKQPDYIPALSTWLEEHRWIDDPKKLVAFTDSKDVCPFGAIFGESFSPSRQGCMDCEDDYSKTHLRCSVAWQKSNVK